MGRMERQDWPRDSRLLCWHCAYGFDHIPAYLPHIDVSSVDHYHLRGNFCSWNCVKSYYFYECRHDRRKADSSLQAIALLAFLTCHRPRFCPILLNKHVATCPCLESWKGVSLAPRRQDFVHFGGSIDINTFRKGAMTIMDSKGLSSCFRPSISRQLEETPRRRMYVYSFVESDRQDRVKAYKVSTEAEEQTETTKPILHRYRKQLNQKSLL